MNCIKRLLLIICFIHYCLQLLKHRVIDSLVKEAAKSSTHDSVKIKLFGDIAWEYIGC